jgi:hypothetical protein
MMASDRKHGSAGLLAQGVLVLSLIGGASAVAQSADKRCDVPPFKGADSAAGTVASMRVVNDGRGCGFHMLSEGTKVESVTITEPPAHGKVNTKGAGVRYTPEPGFAGKDQFTAVSSASQKVLMQVQVVNP